MSKAWLGAAIAAGVAAVGTALLLALTSASAEDPAPATRVRSSGESPRASTPAASVPETLRQAVGLFRTQPEPPAKPVTPSAPHNRPADEDVSPRVREMLNRLADPAPGGINRALQQTVDTQDGRVTVVPGSSLVCIEVPDADVGQAGSCASVDVAVAGGLAASLRSRVDGPGEIVGLAPDGVDAVREVGGDAEAVVRDNVWRLAGSKARKVELIGASGTRTVSVP